MVQLNQSNGQPIPPPNVLHRRAYGTTHAPLKPLYTHLMPCVSLSPAATLLPSTSTAYYIEKNLAPKKLHDAIEPDPLTAAAITPTASLAILAHRSGLVKIHTLPPTNPPAQPRAFRPFHQSNVVAFIAVHPAGTYVALAAADGSIRVHDLSNLTTTHILNTSNITTIAFPPSLTTTDLLVGCDDGSLCLFKLSEKSHGPSIQLRPHVSRVTSILFPTNSQVLVTTSLDSVLAVHSYTPGSILPPTLITSANSITAAATLTDGRVVTASSHNFLRVWDVCEQVEQRTASINVPLVHSSSQRDSVGNGKSSDVDDFDGVSVAHVVTTTKGVLVALSDHTLVDIVVDAASYTTTQIMCGNLEEVYDARFIRKESDALSHVAVASNSSVVWVLRPPTPTNPSWSASAALRAHTANVLALDVTVTTSDALETVFLASAARDRLARLWACVGERWHCVALAEGHADAVAAIALPKRVVAGQFFMVTAAADRTLKVWGLESVHTKVNKLSQESVTSDLSGCQIVEINEAAKDQKNITRLSAKWTMLAHNKDVNAVAVSPDGSIIATGSQDKTLKLWSVNNGKVRATCSGHRRGIWSVLFSPVDRVVLSASGDSSVRIWSVQDGSCLRTLEGHLSGVLRAVFMSRGTQIASCGADGLIKIWTTRTGECDVTIDGHEDRVWGLDVYKDGVSLVSGGADGKVVIWDDHSAEVEEAEVKRRQEQAVMGQVVDSAARAQEWGVAARGALELGMTQKLKSIVTELILNAENAEEELVKMVKGIFSSKECLSKEVRVKGGVVSRKDEDDGDGSRNKWERIERLVLACRDWNASGGTKSAAVAAYVLQAVMTTWTVAQLCDNLKVERRALVEALMAHSARHLERVNQLTTRVSAIEYTLMSMRSVVDVNVGTVPPSLSEKLTPTAKSDDINILKRKRKRREEVDCEY